LLRLLLLAELARGLGLLIGHFHTKLEAGDTLTGVPIIAISESAMKLHLIN
jgi:hypothetical protein